MTAKKIAPPPAIEYPDRRVFVPPTIGEFDTNEVQPPIGKTRADFRQEEFTRAILQHGKYAIWRKAVLCPCFDETSHQAELSCAECDGSGFVYVDPIAIRAHMVSFDKEIKLFEKFGTWQEGNASISVEPKYRLGFRDSIQLKDSLLNFNELLKKGNRRGIRSKLPDGVDSARYRINTMIRLGYQGSSGVEFLAPNEDFRIDENGWIVWLTSGNRRVADGSWLTALYDFHPVYIVVSWPHATRDDVSGRKAKLKNRVISLPIQAMARLDFIVDVNTPAPVTGS
jgi:hypothetical protein